MMKKLMKKGQKDKESKKKKKGKDDEQGSTSSLEKHEKSEEGASGETTRIVVTKTTTSHGGPGEMKTTVVKETQKSKGGTHTRETRVHEKSSDQGRVVVVVKDAKTAATSEEGSSGVTTRVIKEQRELPRVKVATIEKKVEAKSQAAHVKVSLAADNKPSKGDIVTKTTVTSRKSNGPGGERSVTETRSSRDGVSRVTKETDREGRTTREFLEKQTFVTSPGEPVHTSHQTVTRKVVGDGGGTVQIVTKVNAGPRGTVKTVETKTSDKSGTGKTDSIISSTVERKVELPGWMENVKRQKPKGDVTIDDSIEDPSLSFEVKRKQRPKSTGPQVIEEFNSIYDDKKEPFIYLDELELAGREEPKHEVKPVIRDDILEYEIKKKPKVKAYSGRPVNEGSVESLNTERTVDVDFGRLDERAPSKKEAIKRQEGKKSSNKQLYITTNTRGMPEGLEDEDEDGIVEEIILVEKKRRVRIPKNFTPYEPWKPELGLPPPETLVERPKRSPRKTRVYRQNLVNDNVSQTTRNREVELPDLELLAQLVQEIESNR